MTYLSLLSRLSTTIATVPDQTALLKAIIAERQLISDFYKKWKILIKQYASALIN